MHYLSPALVSVTFYIQVHVSLLSGPAILTVFLPLELHIAQRNIPRWSLKWNLMQALSGFCLLISIAAMVGSIAGIYIVSPTVAVSLCLWRSADVTVLVGDCRCLQGCATAKLV